jgi:hypothetical protein
MFDWAYIAQIKARVIKSLRQTEAFLAKEKQPAASRKTKASGSAKKKKK